MEGMPTICMLENLEAAIMHRFDMFQISKCLLCVYLHSISLYIPLYGDGY
uniref:Uncharacterized protein n=1 Tax=Aegilops tauschii subsp. strangulata TaxID=200361 RepID=A0A453IYN1_AEGTS